MVDINKISLHRLSQFVRKMRFNDGDVIAIKSGTPLATKENIDGLGSYLDTTGRRHCIIIVVDDLWNDIRPLDEKAMNKLGWFHVETLREIIHNAEQQTGVGKAAEEKGS